MPTMKTYDRSLHAAARTRDYAFNQLIPYIGNKRKLLDLIQRALSHTGTHGSGVFLDLFAGSGVVSRMAKSLGYEVIANDWEPYTRPINTCYIACNEAPAFANLGGYEQTISKLNSLPPRIDWVTDHLCPRNDEDYDTEVERMFYMRKNGMRIDAIRHQIEFWLNEAVIDDTEACCLLAPLLYQACYRSNTSGVFKGFHNGWGGQTGTALYRIAGDLALSPAVFFNNGFSNSVACKDAQLLAEELSDTQVDVAYLDPPYNQHPYGSNYHVLNSVALWDKPRVPKRITRGTKSAIRRDWRTERRSAYNHRNQAGSAYRRLLDTVNARFTLTSYSTDGTIPLEEMLGANAEHGRVDVEVKGYKRYRVSSQRFSRKPMNVEFVLVLDTRHACDKSVDELRAIIESAEEDVLNGHPESRPSGEEQLTLFDRKDSHG